MRAVQWEELEPALLAFVPLANRERGYLEDAFSHTETLWFENFAKVRTPRMVMLSEAPLYGSARRYFYNPETSFGGFFHMNDAEAVLQGSFNPHSTKQSVLDQLAKAGFLILDLFPFALNDEDTSITYRTLSARKYRELFQRTAPAYFDKKLDLVLQRNIPKFFFRYLGLQRKVGDLVDAELVKHNLGRTECVNGTNMSLDREKLRRLCFSGATTQPPAPGEQS